MHTARLHSIKNTVFPYTTLKKVQPCNSPLTCMPLKFDVFHKMLITSKKNIKYQ